MPDILLVEIGQRISKRRTELELSRNALSDKAMSSICPIYLWEIEEGQKCLSALKLRNLAIALGVSTDWILGLTDEKER